MVETIRQGDIPGVQLRRRQLLGVSVERAWLWLTDPDLASQWLAERVEISGENGDTLILESRQEGQDVRERGVVSESVPLRRWTLSFERLDEPWKAPTRVTFEVVSRPPGSELSVFHEGFQRLSLSRCLTIWEFYRRRWSAALDRLGRVSGSD